MQSVFIHHAPSKRNKRRWARALALCGSLAFSCLFGIRSDYADLESWTIVPPLAFMENDSFFGIADRHYTNGLYAAATSGKISDCRWCVSAARILMLTTQKEPASYRYGFFLGQSMFTPEVLSTAVPNPRDRPYAGWAFLGARLYR